MKAPYVILWVAGVMACTPQPRPESQDTTLAPGMHERVLQDARGLERPYLVHVPTRVDGPLPVVLMLHGGGGGTESARHASRLHETGQRHGFLTIYPQGVSNPRGTKARPFATWNASPQCCGEAQRVGSDDVAYLRAVVRDVARVAPIDPRRIYAIGHSNGGLMSYRLACEAPDFVAAVAPVGAPGADWGRCKRPVPVMHVHGTQDTCATYAGGTCGGCFQRVLGELLRREIPPKTWSCPSVQETLEPWKRLAGARGDGSKTWSKNQAQCTTWKGDGAEVALCTDAALGHIWPGSQGPKGCRERPNARRCKIWNKHLGPPSATLDNDLLWSFLSRHTCATCSP